MLTEQQMRSIFEKPYDRTTWLSVLKENLGLQEIFARPREESLGKDNDVRKLADVYIPLGKMTTKEGREIGIYEVPVHLNVKIERNKVGLRNLLKKIYTEDVDAAFVAFDQGDKWRFSYISEIGMEENGIRVKKTTDPKRFTYLLGKGEKCRTAAERFDILTNQSAKGISLKALEEAFNVEKMSKAFFDEYRKHYGKFTAYLTGKDEDNKIKNEPTLDFRNFKGEYRERDARDFIKKLLGRIVFLYFLQKKRWLGVPEGEDYGNGDENFMSHLFADCNDKENFYPLVLVPLFFETLNTENRKGELFEVNAGLFNNRRYDKVKIPYLNGGLFDDTEPNTDLIRFPEGLFKDLFAFFDQYNFTVYEDSPDEHTVAVDPEMLGHIFENLLEDNKDKGAFYTPKEIVHYMCQESLIEYLHTNLNGEQNDNGEQVARVQIEALVKQGDASSLTEWDKQILEALKDVKICDPAIGSGAFPMGLLLEIFHLVETLYYLNPDETQDVWQLGDKWNPAKVKEQIIQNSIYGVDIEKGAVDIARLRFWLSLVVDEEIPKPLPNLDYKIVVGNSLLSKFEGEVIDIDWEITEGKQTDLFGNENVIKLQELLHKITQRQKKYFQPNGKGKEQSALAIRDLKIEILINQLEIMIKTKGIETKPSGNSKRLTAQTELYLQTEGWKKNIKSLQAIKKNREVILKHFDWKLDFPEIMNGQIATKVGFDIVIANPPYVNAMELKKSISNTDYIMMKEKYVIAKGPVDLYVYFFEVVLKLLKENGTISFITPNKYLSVSYGEALRKFLGDKIKILSIVDYSDIKVFKKASIYPVLTFLKGCSTQVDYEIKVGKSQKDSDSLSFTKTSSLKLKVTEGNIWGFLLNEKMPITEKVMSQSVPLKNVCKINATSTAGEAELYHELINERSGYKLINTGTIDRYASLWNWGTLVDKGEKFKTPYLPKTNPIISVNRHQLYRRPKIILAKIALSTEAFYDSHGEYASINTNCLHSFSDSLNPAFLLSWINSKLFQYTFECFFEGLKMSGGYLLYSSPNVSAMYINIPEEKVQSKFVEKVNSILAYKIKDPFRDTTSVEKQIDLMFYKLLFLDYKEACHVEGNTTWMSKEDYNTFTIQ